MHQSDTQLSNPFSLIPFPNSRAIGYGGPSSLFSFFPVGCKGLFQTGILLILRQQSIQIFFNHNGERLWQHARRAYNFNMTVEARPNNQFQVQATNNRYVINVIGDPFPTGTDLPSINVFAELPSGITWTPANSGRWNCFAVTTQIDCDYRGPVTTTIDALSVAVNVAADVGVRAELTAQLNVTARILKS